MDIYTINYIKSNPLVYKYLRENSSWYKYLNRDSNNLKLLEEQMKKDYKLSSVDKLKNISDKIETISNFLDVLK